MRFTPAGIAGDNTDGAGLVRDIEANLGFALAGRRVLLLGAGGAARGVLAPLLERRPASLVIANRTPERAARLAAEIGAACGGPLSACAFADLAGQAPFDVLINATSASLAGEPLPLPAKLCAPGSLAYDMVYGRGETPFLEAARKAGATRCADGLGMLIEQAAEAFHLWRGVRPDTRALHAGRFA
jgi:shikimate dehydrogenase